MPRTLHVDRTYADLESAGVALVPGTAYGLSPYFRLSIATDIETLTDGVERLARAVSDLR